MRLSYKLRVNAALCRETNRMNIEGIILLVAVGGVVYIGTQLFSKDSRKRARVHAVAQGIAVSDVSRQVPITNGTWNRIKYELKEEICTLYTIPHECESPQPWKLLQRFDPEFKETDYWKYEASFTPSEELQSAISSFKEEFKEDYYEIEIQRDSVNIYWSEWGGKQIVNQLNKHMKVFSCIER